MSTAIIIAGMHRSGTSATTGALRLAGVSLGEVLEPAPDNPKGYFENQRAVEIHERLLAALGSSWDDVQALPENWQQSDAATVAKQAIGQLIDNEFADAQLWAVKDPRICRFIPLWREVLEARGISVAVLFVVRHPDEVAASISARDGWLAPLGKLLWMRHVFEAEGSTRDLPRTVLSYESLLQRPDTALRLALQRLSLETTFEPESEWRENLTEFIDKRDRHHSRDGLGEVNDEFSGLLDAVYEEMRVLEAKGGDWERFESLASSTYASLGGWGPYVSAVAAKASKHRTQASALEIELIETRSKLNAQVKWSEGAVVRQDELRLQLERTDAKAKDVMADMMASLGVQVTALREAISTVSEDRRRVAEERDALLVHRDALNADYVMSIENINRVIQDCVANIGRLEESNASLVRSINSERAQWMDEREVWAAERSRLAERREETESELSRLKSELESQQAFGARLALELSEFQGARIALLQRNAELGEAVKTLTSDIHEVGFRNVQLNEELRDMSARMEVINRSLSWRLTKPLRSLGAVVRRWFGTDNTTN